MKITKILIALLGVALVIATALVISACNAELEEISELWEFDDMVVRAETGDNTIGGASTRLLDKEEGRVVNINLAVEKINGIVLQPGEEFSFNDKVGERSEARGFKEATALFGTEKVREVGGGVCQVSTTIYQAVKNAGLEIEERHQHKKKIPYAEEGQDATVDFAADFDLRFKNNLDRPIKMHVSTDGEYVHVTIDKL